MPILSADVKLRPGLLTSNTTPSLNGGRMAYTEIVSGVKNNTFPDVSASERLNGLTRWRKVFLHINQDSLLALNENLIFFKSPTAGDDYMLLQSATPTGTEATDKNEAALYGVGKLSANASASATSISVTCEHADYATLLPFRVGMKIRISNIPLGGGAGTEEFVALSAVSITGAAATLTFAGYPLANSYLAATPTIVSGVLEVALIAGGFNTPVVTSAAGTFAHAVSGNLTVPSKGSVADAWTLTFTNATTFTAAGTVAGALAGTGTVGADYAPNNTNTTSPYFRILSASWGGTFLAGDTVTFNTTQAAAPMLVRQRVPAGAGSINGSTGTLASRGQST